jgi:hypothetical protein
MADLCLRLGENAASGEEVPQRILCAGHLLANGRNWGNWTALWGT